MSIDVFQAIRLNEPNLAAIIADVPDINIRDEDGQCLLHEAAASKNEQATKELIRCGIDVNAKDKHGQTPLHFAANRSCAALVRLILSNGGDFAIQDEHDNTPLWTAVFKARGNYATVATFLEFGAAQVATLKNRYGRSPLDFAKQIGDSELVGLLETT